MLQGSSAISGFSWLFGAYFELGEHIFPTFSMKGRSFSVSILSWYRGGRLGRRYNTRYGASTTVHALKGFGERAQLRRRRESLPFPSL